jgi:phosphoribosylformimino-5-aminoimidazole carboxamide ribotide isomerase
VRIIPVLDLKGGVAVHAVRGQRESYAPVRSVLTPSAEPVVLGRAFLEKLGCGDCYVADLDAITGRGNHAATVRALAALGLEVWLDAGIASPADARHAVASGAGRLIVGTETLRHPGDLDEIAAAAIGHRCVLSLDLREGRLLGGSGEIAALDHVDLARLAWAAGFRTFIVLDLARVGSGDGVQTAAALDVQAALGDAEIVVGGGVRGPSDLRTLADLGFAAVLVATALHTGAIA